MTTTKKSKNALVHGVYTSDIILPWEKADEFRELLAGFRTDFSPEGVMEDDIVFDMAVLAWKKRRVNRIMQLAMLQNQFAARIDATGKRSVEGIQTEIKAGLLKQKRTTKELTGCVSELAQAMDSLASEIRKKNRPPLGKIGSNIRYILRVLEELEPKIGARLKTEDVGKDFDLSSCVHILERTHELEARLDGLIAKAFQRLVMAREFRRQYPPKPTPKLIAPSTAKKAIGTVVKKMSDDENENNDNDNNDNNTDDPDRPESFDWEHEYDEARK